MSIRVPVEISRALYSNSLALPVLLQLARSLQCIFRAFRVRTDMHSNYFDFANNKLLSKNYVGGSGEGAVAPSQYNEI